MSKLDELIQEFCPDGVEYKRLGEVSEMQRGTSVTKRLSQMGISLLYQAVENLLITATLPIAFERQ